MSRARRPTRRCTRVSPAQPIVAVSAVWLSSSHADPHGVTLRIVGSALEREAPKYCARTGDGGAGFREMGVYWAWGSTPQPSPASLKAQHSTKPWHDANADLCACARRESIRAPPSHLLRPAQLLKRLVRAPVCGCVPPRPLTGFGHQAIVALLVTRVPDDAVGGRGQRKRSRTYERSGWPAYERTAAHLKRFARERRSLHVGTWDLIVECGAEYEPGDGAGAAGGGGTGGTSGTRGGRWPLVLPADLSDALRDKLSFSVASDAAVCAEIYQKQFASQMSAVRTLGLDASDARQIGMLGTREARMLGRGLASCACLHELRLERVPGFDDGALAAFSSVLISDPSPYARGTSALATLSLEGNRIGDAGVTALASAAERGALRTLRSLTLSRNLIGAGGVVALCAASRRGALVELRELNLFANRLRDSGIAALGAEVRQGAVRALRALYLGANGIGSDGLIALTEACRQEAHDGIADGTGNDALPRLRTLHLYSNQIGHAAAISIGKALHEWGLPEIHQIVLDGNAVGARAQRFVRDALQRRAWARTLLHQWQHRVGQRKQRRLAAAGERERGLTLNRSASLVRARSTLLPAIASWNVASVTNM